MKTLRRLCLVILLATLSACALLKPPREAYWLDPAAPRPASDAVSLMHYSSYARKLSGKLLAEETERVRLAQATEKSDFRQLQYAIALSVPGASAADHRRALQLLEPLTQPGEARDTDLQALASLMRATLAEQRRLEDGSLSQQRRAEDLEKKLEALKEIEKSLLPANQPARGRN